MSLGNSISRSDLKRTIRSKTDERLLADLSLLRSTEKTTIADILLYLYEVDRRRLHLSRGFSSLYEFCLEELGYNKDEAYYRISAMRLISDVPEVESQLREGSLSLTVAAKAQIAFRRENQKRKEERALPLDVSQKREVLLDLAQCTKKESEKALALHFPQVAPQEKTQPLCQNRTLLQFSVDDELMVKLEKVKCLLAHKNPAYQWESLISDLTDMALAKLDPELKKTKAAKPKVNDTKKDGLQDESISISIQPDFDRIASCEQDLNELAGPQKSLLPQDDQNQTKNPHPFVPARKGRQYISVHLKRKLWLRAKGQCEFVHFQTGRRCSSKYALQTDHKWPVALGGDNGAGNLRWFCRSHNVFAAQEALGVSRKK